ncbi:hypothetical protein GJAV_G00036930 [Gymnothorax javanicus]|nr:hypothetical protein GJAV_G00036930 [Gymnothorax javanicus]
MDDGEHQSETLLVLIHQCLHLMLDSCKKQKAVCESRIENLHRSQAVVRNSNMKYVSVLRRGRQRRNGILLKAIYHQRRKVSLWRHLRSTEWWDHIARGFTDSQWQRSFRMSRETFQYLCNKVKPAIERRNTVLRMCVPVEKRVAIALWKLATSSHYGIVGHRFGVGISTVCKCLREFCQAVNEIVLPEVLPEPKPEDLAEMATVFEQKLGVPLCIGAVDSMYIPVIAPKDSHSNYCNSQDWHSIVLQAAVSAEGLFWNICTGFPGSMRKADILRQSSLWALASDGALLSNPQRGILGEDVGYYVIADSSYPLRSWVMKPFEDTGALSNQQKRFNSRICTARTVLTNAFERLKGRWQCLTKRNDCSADVATAMIVTCCVLHNLCEKRGELFTDEVDVGDLQQPTQTAGIRDEPEGTAARNALMQYFSVEQ